MKQPRTIIHRQNSQRFHLHPLLFPPLHHKKITPSPIHSRKKNFLSFRDDIKVSKEDKHNIIIFQNVNSLEISIAQRTSENTCDGISNYEIDITCLVETNIHWRHTLGESTLRNTTTRHWKIPHISISEIDLPWKALYNPGGTTILSLQPIYNIITSSSQDPHGLGR